MKLYLKYIIISTICFATLIYLKVYVEGNASDIQKNSRLSFNYIINDFNFYPVPDLPKPQKGVAIVDPVFHTTVTRITDATTDFPGKRNYAFPGYPKHDIENADGTYLLIQAMYGSSWHILNARPPYEKIREIPSSLIGWGSPIDCRWDNKDPDVIYFSYRNKFYKYNVSTNRGTVLYDFSHLVPSRPNEKYPLCSQTMHEEGDASDDRRYWAFDIYCYDPKEIEKWKSQGYIVYDKDYYGKDKGEVISIIKPNNPNWRYAGFISMSPSGKYVWIGDEHHIYTRDFSKVKKIDFWGHADVAISAEGREVIFGIKHRPEMRQNWAVMADIETGEITYLVPIGIPGYHFSGNSYERPGWGVVSTYLPAYPKAESNWGDHEVYMIELTKRKVPSPRVWRIAHTHTVRKGYIDAPFAKINRKGTKIWFGSGWGKSALNSSYDVYQIDLPSTWYEDLKNSVNSSKLSK